MLEDKNVIKKRKWGLEISDETGIITKGIYFVEPNYAQVTPLAEKRKRDGI